ncbi:MAG: hypothetical protein WC747_02780 [Candidatus Babeliales bacterium]|jgi:hypothetical protein
MKKLFLSLVLFGGAYKNIQCSELSKVQIACIGGNVAMACLHMKEAINTSQRIGSDPDAVFCTAVHLGTAIVQATSVSINLINPETFDLNSSICMTALSLGMVKLGRIAQEQSLHRSYIALQQSQQQRQQAINALFLAAQVQQQQVNLLAVQVQQPQINQVSAAAQSL